MINCQSNESKLFTKSLASPNQSCKRTVSSPEPLPLASYQTIGELDESQFPLAHSEQVQRKIDHAANHSQSNFQMARITRAVL